MLYVRCFANYELLINHINKKMKISIDGEKNPCNFMGCSYDERAGFQTININVQPDFEKASEEKIKDCLLETESSCPVTVNIKTGTTINNI